MWQLDADAQLAAGIRNAAWMVRNYPRRIQRGQRERAIHELGLVVREAFNSTENFEPLLAAVVDGLRPRPEPEPF